MALHAFVDESHRNGTYLICAVMVAPQDAHAVRRAMRGLLLGSQERLHFKNESGRRQRRILADLSTSPLVAHIYSTPRRPPREGRAEILRALVPDLLRATASRVTFESQVGQDELDRQVMFEALGKVGSPNTLAYYHALPRTEPMLWPPDAIAWAYGKGGDWQRVSRG